MEIEQFISLVDFRNQKIFPQILGEDERSNSRAYWPAQRHKRFVAQVILHASVARIKVKGLNNLYEAADLSEENKEVHSSNHITDLDHSLKRFIFCKVGLRELADRLVFPAGLKMIERPQIRIFMPGENALFVMTPFDAQDLAGALAVRDSLTSYQQAILDKYEQNATQLTKESAREISRLEKAGAVFVSYPEATRSRTGKLGPGQEMITAHYSKSKDDVYVVPMMFGGINKINPVGKMVRPGRVEVSMVVGKPYLARDIWVRKQERGIVARGVAINRVMARLAVLAPELVSPQDREFYGAFLDGYNPNIKGEYQYLSKYN